MIEGSLGFGIMVLGFIAPVILTVLNIILLVSSEKILQKSKNLIDGAIFVLGIPLIMILISVCSFVEWDVPIYSYEKYDWFGSYTPISLESLPTILTLCAVALCGYAVLRIRGTHLPPLVAALCYAGMLLGIVLTVLWIVQLWAAISEYITWYLLLLPLNYVVCCIRLVRQTVEEYSRQFREAEYQNPFLRLCSRFLGNATGLLLFSFVLLIPLVCVVLIVLLLFGQRPDSVIRAFTETAQWTLSQKIPPPLLEGHSHYLCTVAACGDEKTVKPLRVGRRHGRLIVVNRQLLVANAFEDVIAEKTPRLHRAIRGFYDAYGLPISRHITTKRRSNIVYYVMKPLEWVFLAVLYLVDEKPENRIAMQYIG